MNKSRLLISVIILMIFITGWTKPSPAKAQTFLYNSKYKDDIFSKIIPSYALAAITEDCSVSEKAGILSSKEGELKKGAIVEILQESSEKWYKVESADEEITGWVNRKYLNIFDTPPALKDTISLTEAEDFANIMDFPSGSGYFIWTDVARQHTYVFKKFGNRYRLEKDFLCATGKNQTPTTRGFFTISDRGGWFYSKRFESGAMYWLRFNGTYLFHSVAMDKHRNVIDGVLGERRSSGCVRLAVDDAKWLYDNVPKGTTVFIH